MQSTVTVQCAWCKNQFVTPKGSPPEYQYNTIVSQYPCCSDRCRQQKMMHVEIHGEPFPGVIVFLLSNFISPFMAYLAFFSQGGIGSIIVGGFFGYAAIYSTACPGDAKVGVYLIANTLVPLVAIIIAAVVDDCERPMLNSRTVRIVLEAYSCISLVAGTIWMFDCCVGIFWTIVVLIFIPHWIRAMFLCYTFILWAVKGETTNATPMSLWHKFVSWVETGETTN